MNATENSLRDYYATVIDSVGDGVLVLDRDGTVTLMNPAAEEITGLSRRQAQGNPFSRLFRNDTVLLEMAAKTASSGMSISDYENIALRSGGKLTPVSATTSPLVRADGEQIGTVIILRDLTNIRELEGAVRKSDRLAALGTLAAGLAHEIKNPLGGIKGAAQLLAQEFSDESEHHEYTGIILREVDRVNRIVEELLDLTSPRKLRIGEVNLHRTLGDIILLQRGALPGSRVTIIQQFDPSIPPILGDAELLHQLFLNLVKNAVEAVGEAGLIRVSTRIVSDYSLTQKGERRSRMVAVEVADDGPGIEPEDLEYLFTPFYTTKPKGTGLGLVISQKIVSEHRGMLKVDSNTGRGTTFTVMLPLIQ